MLVQPVSVNFKGQYHDLSNKILKSQRNELIDLAEYFHTAKEFELNQITKSSEKAYKMLKEAIDMVIVRKKCYIADGSSFCKQRAKDLNAKASLRNIFLKG